MKARWLSVLAIPTFLACADEGPEGAADNRAADTVALANGTGPEVTGTAAAETRTGTRTAGSARTGPARPAGRTGTTAETAVVIQVQEEVPGLIEQVRTHPLDAQHIAQAKFPAGKIQAGWLERRGGNTLAYRFRVVNEDGNTWDVIIDSFDGDIIFTNLIKP